VTTPLGPPAVLLSALFLELTFSHLPLMVPHPLFTADPCAVLSSHSGVPLPSLSRFAFLPLPS
jgi:hypothetical protein